MIHNFSAGPAVLPNEVLQKVQSELLNFNSTGISILETSHRSKAFVEVIRKAEQDFIKLLGIPDTHQVLFMQGGASSQFSAVVYNLISDVHTPVDYIVSGQWSGKAYKEAQRIGFYS